VIPKIVFIIPNLQPGGAERQLYYLLKSWPDKRKALLIYFRDGSWSSKFYSLGIDIKKIDIAEIRVNYIGHYINIFLRALKVSSFLKNNKPVIVYSWLFEASLATYIASRFTNIKQVSAVRFGSNHYFVGPYKINKFIEFTLYSIIYHSSIRIIANSFAGKNTLMKYMKVDSKIITVVHNTFPHKVQINEQIHGSKGDRYNIGFVGRLNELKNPQQAIEIVGALKLKNVVLHILGREDGISQKELLEYCELLNVNVKCYGHVDDTNSFYKQFDVLISTSNTLEGCSNVIMEALSFGVPVVAYKNVGDNEYLLGNGRGVLVEQSDFEGFVLAVEGILSTKSPLYLTHARKQFIKNNFNSRAVVQKTYQVLLDI